MWLHAHKVKLEVASIKGTWRKRIEILRKTTWRLSPCLTPDPCIAFTEVMWKPTWLSAGQPLLLPAGLSTCFCKAKKDIISEKQQGSQPASLLDTAAASTAQHIAQTQTCCFYNPSERTEQCQNPKKKFKRDIRRKKVLQLYSAYVVTVGPPNARQMFVRLFGRYQRRVW